jgi:hypothetical protein
VESQNPFELLKQFSHALRVKLVDDGAAVGGDDFEGSGFDFEEARNEITSAGFKVAEDADLVVEAGLGVRPAECLVHAAVVADADDGALRVFDLVHGSGW